jgi:Flp pilus assembly protein TadG
MMTTGKRRLISKVNIVFCRPIPDVNTWVCIDVREKHASVPVMQVSVGMHPCRNAVRRQGRGTKGSEVVEFGLVFLPMIAYLFLILDLGWIFFTKSTLQFAAREGARYAVTSKTRTGLGQLSSIQQVVQENAMGFLAGSAGLGRIHVRFFAPDTLQDISNTAHANAGGNLVEVSVEGYTFTPLASILKSNAPLMLSAKSWDRMEASPPTGPPPL